MSDGDTPPDLAALWAGLDASPADEWPAALLVIADWFEERGRAAEAEAVRWCASNDRKPEFIHQDNRADDDNWPWAWFVPRWGPEHSRISSALCYHMRKSEFAESGVADGPTASALYADLAASWADCRRWGVVPLGHREQWLCPCRRRERDDPDRSLCLACVREWAGDDAFSAIMEGR